MEITEKSESLPLRTRISLAVISILTDTSCRRDGTVNRRIINFFKYISPANKNSVNGVSTFDVVVDPARKLWYRVFVPTSPAAESSVSIPVIVFFHGGGFAFLSADSKPYDAVCRRFARKIGAVVVSVDYRLTPEHKYPAQYDDGFDVLRFLDEENQFNCLPKNVDLSRCFLAGDSAGANLAHHVALRFSKTNFQRLKVIGLVAIQPFFGGEERTDSELRLSLIVTTKRADFLWKAFLPEEEAVTGGGRDHEVINVSGPRAVDLSSVDRFPPVLVVIGGRDPLQDWQRRYYDWLKKNGKEVELLEYPTMIHAFYVFPELTESGQLIDQVKDFVNRRSGSVAIKDD
ncbi:probable carboxylesterase 18 [Impatiens glandulifera]|uniref:probable carboxylesterase 18 n=1 Tax=Impatiens glandulifera TaxID=253017 RepID=UPI001FB0AAA2|nr:probable carboxylesterase 18 [Impatiens glandulifera]